MSVTIRKENGIDNPLSYGLRWVCHTPEQSTFAHAPATKLGIADVSETTPRTTNAPRMAPGIGGHNIDPPPLRLRPFKGDVAIALPSELIAKLFGRVPGCGRSAGRLPLFRSCRRPFHVIQRQRH